MKYNPLLGRVHDLIKNKHFCVLMKTSKQNFLFYTTNLFILRRIKLI